MNGGLLFGIWLLVGNFVNSFMEEGLFRGIILPLFESRMRTLVTGLMVLVPVVEFVRRASTPDDAVRARLELEHRV